MRYKTLGKTGLRVSEVALGTGTFGTRLDSGATREESKAVFEAFADAGGNLLDCADAYQGGEAEELLGEFIRQDRASFAISTKYTSGMGARSILKTGNSRKAMRYSLEQSLKRLGTDYVDIFWVHFPDHVTPVEEMVRGLDDVVSSGQALYVGLSDFPAWRIATAATLAELRGSAPISAIQVEYNLAERTAERELLPMASAFGLAALVWSPLAGGLLTGKYRRGETGRLQSGMGAGGVRTLEAGKESALFDALDAVAGELDATIAQVSIAWIKARGSDLGVSAIPILGARRAEQLRESLGALDLRLRGEQIARLNAASEVALGFPHEFVWSEGLLNTQSGQLWDRLDRPRHAIR